MVALDDSPKVTSAACASTMIAAAVRAIKSEVCPRSMTMTDDPDTSETYVITDAHARKKRSRAR